MTSKIPPNVSEIAQFLAQTERERQMLEWAASGLVDGSAKHLFIKRRYQKIGAVQEQLATLVGEKRAIEIMCTIVDAEDVQTSP